MNSDHLEFDAEIRIERVGLERVIRVYNERRVVMITSDVVQGY